AWGDRPVERGPVGADDCDGVAALDAEPAQPRRIGAHLGEHLVPGPGLPDAEILEAKGRTAAKPLGIAHEQLRKRIRARGIRSGHGDSLLLCDAVGPAPAIPLAASNAGLLVRP